MRKRNDKKDSSQPERLAVGEQGTSSLQGASSPGASPTAPLPAPSPSRSPSSPESEAGPAPGPSSSAAMVVQSVDEFPVAPSAYEGHAAAAAKDTKVRPLAPVRGQLVAV